MESVCRNGDVDPGDFIAGAEFIGLGGLLVQRVAAVDMHVVRIGGESHEAAYKFIAAGPVQRVHWRLYRGDAVCSGWQTGDAKVALVVGGLALVHEQNTHESARIDGVFRGLCCWRFGVDLLHIYGDLRCGRAVGVQHPPAHGGASL